MIPWLRNTSLLQSHCFPSSISASPSFKKHTFLSYFYHSASNGLFWSELQDQQKPVRTDFSDVLIFFSYLCEDALVKGENTWPLKTITSRILWAPSQNAAFTLGGAPSACPSPSHPPNYIEDGSNDTSPPVRVCSQSCLALCDPMDCSPPGFSVHGISQARIVEWVAISYSRGSSPTRDQTCIPFISCFGRQILYHPGSPLSSPFFSSPFFCSGESSKSQPLTPFMSPQDELKVRQRIGKMTSRAITLSLKLSCNSFLGGSMPHTPVVKQWPLFILSNSSWRLSMDISSWLVGVVQRGSYSTASFPESTVDFPKQNITVR